MVSGTQGVEGTHRSGTQGKLIGGMEEGTQSSESIRKNSVSVWLPRISEQTKTVLKYQVLSERGRSGGGGGQGPVLIIEVFKN